MRKLVLAALALMAVAYGVIAYRAVKEMVETERDEDGRLKLFDESLNEK